jgi:hypothetical protein
VRPSLEYASACWNPYRECQINALDRVHRKAAKFVNHYIHSVMTSGIIFWGNSPHSIKILESKKKRGNKNYHGSKDKRFM